MKETHSKILSSSLWIAAIITVAFFSFLAGKNSNSTSNTVLPTQTVNTPLLPAQAETTPTSEADLQTSCAKSGPSQKKDYLTSYTIKEGDTTINKIAEEQLGDVSRNTEITTLNQDQKQLMIGSVIYLPPDFIKSSSGNLVELSGKLVRKDNSYWQLSYGESEKDLGVLMPAYWFKDFPDKDSYKIGDCLTVLLDNGVKAYTIKKKLT